MRVQEQEADEGILEIRVQKMSKQNIIFRKHITVDIDALFEFYLAITCFVCINTLQIVLENA